MFVTSAQVFKKYRTLGVFFYLVFFFNNELTNRQMMGNSIQSQAF